MKYIFNPNWKQGNFLVYAASLLLLVILGFRTFQFSVEPDFNIGITRYHRPVFKLEGVAFEKKTKTGTLEILANRAKPGHLSVGNFFLGPTTFLSLSGVEIKHLKGDRLIWLVRGKTARMGRENIELKKGSVIVSPGGNEQRHGPVRINLVSGRLSIN